MAIDEPSAQLYDDLSTSVQVALATGRPILHHLNADSSWLIQLPRPESAIKYGARVYYNILLDPWFTGPQSDVASWFSQQFHATPSAVQSVAELEELARDVEISASRLRVGAKRKSNAELERENGEISGSFIDAVAICHEFTDHCHKDTLLELRADVPVFAAKPAAELIRSWNHFKTVTTLPDFASDGDTDWRSTSLAPLPEWVGITRVMSKDDALYYHSAIMITWNNRRSASKSGHAATDDDEESAEALIYTPHGVHADALQSVASATPKIQTLAFLHGQHNVKISSTFGTALQLNLGSHNGLAAQRILNARYWIGTHDEVKKGGGLVAWFLQRKIITVKEALEAERSTNGADHSELNGATVDDPDHILEAFKDCNWLELQNGESRLLV
ncbi:hypothetical protein AMS68_003065 [Peltaster fructicola]|uniref:Uncharacterized protein n=1 Tax=Peltaster fructicola TaxID=286661 RepID=A0A6H0XSE7_9PEZI|nr:hypothetical protein AMS68_003065 [Peltaster fructicola]